MSVTFPHFCIKYYWDKVRTSVPNKIALDLYSYKYQYADAVVISKSGQVRGINVSLDSCCQLIDSIRENINLGQMVNSQ